MPNRIGRQLSSSRRHADGARARRSSSVFQIGEVIPLELSFTSSTPDKYRLEMATITTQPAGSTSQSFAVQPSSGWDDPLGFYFDQLHAPDFGAEVALSAKRSAIHAAGSPIRARNERAAVVVRRNPGQISRCGQVRARVEIRGPRLRRSRRRRQDGLERVTANHRARDRGVGKLRTLQQALAGLPQRPRRCGRRPEAARTPNGRRSRPSRYLGTAAAAREMARRLLPNERNWADDLIQVGTWLRPRAKRR